MDEILKGHILFSKRMRFPASVFYCNNNPDEINVTRELQPGRIMKVERLVLKLLPLFRTDYVPVSFYIY